MFNHQQCGSSGSGEAAFLWFFTKRVCKKVLLIREKAIDKLGSAIYVLKSYSIEYITVS